MSPPLDVTTVARFAAAHGFTKKQALRELRSMTPVRRGNVAAIYATDELLSDDEKILADSLQIRMELKTMSEQRSIDARSCPYLEGTAEYGNWHAELHNANGSCTCHGRLKEY